MKKILLKAVILCIVFISVFATYFITTMEPKEDNKTILTTASLPIVSMIHEGNVVNTLHGYISNMNNDYMREAITPADGSRKVNIVVDLYDNVVAGISYELRSLDSTRLIENKAIEKFEIDNGKLAANIKLSQMIDKDTEYQFILKIITEKHGEVKYYTRVIEQEDDEVVEHINFVKGFSQSTLDKEKATEYLPYLEPKQSSDNTNLGITNINSSFNSVTWNNLKVSRVTEPIIAIKELLGDVGCYELNYKIKAQNEEGNDEYYNVTEYFRVKKGVNVMYMYVYNRYVNQIFESNQRVVSATRINLGIDSDMDVENKCSPTGAYVAFVKERNLWLMDMNSNTMVNVISFETGKDNDVRDVFNENNIEIVSVNSNGNVLFMVYGYMNKGDHEGEVGTSLYQYNRQENSLSEMVFVTSDKPYEILKNQIGKFAYVTDDKRIYLMVEDNIYTITTDSNEYVQIADNLEAGNFIINDDNNIVAWHENGTQNEATSIRVIDVANKKDYTITAEQGDYLKVVGFIGDDLVYGMVHKKNVYKDEIGNTVYPMYKLIVDLYDNDEIAQYSKKNVFVTKATIVDNMLELERVKKQGKEYVKIDNDQYINKENNTKSDIELSSITTELKETELVLKFAYTVTSDNKLSNEVPASVEFVASNDIGREDKKDIDEYYYVYGAGHMLLKTLNVAQAINLASEESGVVVDGKGEYVWARLSKLDNKVAPSATDAASPHYSNINEIMQNSSIDTLDVSTIELEDVLYYITKEMPVLVELPERGIVAISGYSGYSGNVDTIYFRAYDGESFNMTINKAKKQLDECGNRYIVVKN